MKTRVIETKAMQNTKLEKEHFTHEELNAPDTTQGFTGKELDDETGLNYYGARYYDAKIGRFVSIDPWEGNLTDPQSLNKYSYTLNNPLKFNDPTGKNPALVLVPPAAELIMAGTIAAYLALKTVIQNATENSLGPVSTPAYTETSPNNTAGEIAITAPVTNTGHSVPMVQTPTNTGGNVAPVPSINIVTTPAYQPESTGSCGQNMSCANQPSVGGYELSRHALDQMKERNITTNDIERAIITGESFSYEGNKTGYYDSKTNIFVGTGEKVTTVINPAKPENYIKNLKERSNDID